jgi:hypothetical protein
MGLIASQALRRIATSREQTITLQPFTTMSKSPCVPGNIDDAFETFLSVSDAVSQVSCPPICRHRGTVDAAKVLAAAAYGFRDTSAHGFDKLWGSIASAALRHDASDIGRDRRGLPKRQHHIEPHQKGIVGAGYLH